ncbi:hypothetical protein FHP25_35775 [Vineibacter terrae]|uniref:Helicase/UvrB N-terminal domain-containing protein n=1 Tax=Vineibacter terrae TaxID=2586908 RepID=A0A5C8P954_9HYPH|nr:DEAD/DEAH box helicase family protein [Vineibacter terrae]TXL70194.1 hypothetical protein FHP25_35775 [Vineibacter terrae]
MDSPPARFLYQGSDLETRTKNEQPPGRRVQAKADQPEDDRHRQQATGRRPHPAHPIGARTIEVATLVLAAMQKARADVRDSGVGDPFALRRLLDLDGDVDLRVFESGTISFHPKSWIFHFHSSPGIAIVGSSNLSATALRTGVEWNYRVVDPSMTAGWRDVLKGFEELFFHARVRELSHSWIDSYAERRSIGHLRNFAPDAFDYIIVDEFHHAAARTYRNLIEHFTPKFMLSLTATPDRTDGSADVASHRIGHSLTKSYKMLLLRAMLRADEFPGSLHIDQLVTSLESVAGRNPHYRADLSARDSQ